MATLQSRIKLHQNEFTAKCRVPPRLNAMNSRVVRQREAFHCWSVLRALQTFSLIAVFLAASAMASGCGRSRVPAGPPRLPTVPAGGVLTVRGLPCAGASIVFHHEEGQASAIGTTDAEGRFTLSTYQHHDGAPVGNYLLTVATNNTTEVEPGVLAPLSTERSRSVIAAAYADPQSSSLTCEIPSAGKTDIRINLK